MKIFIAEDSDKKYQDIKSLIQNHLSDVMVSFHRAKTFSDATKNIFSEKYDLLLIDLLMPRRNGEEPADISSEIVSQINESPFNSEAVVVGISQFEDLVDSLRKEFVNSGIFLIHYSSESEDWKISLKICLQRIEMRSSFDFVIFCALEKERNAFRDTNSIVGELRNYHGLDCLELTIGDHSGVCITPPRMGLVDASIICARALVYFTPKLICTSGICAGIKEEVSIGTLIISERAWEHQAGKWAKEGFSPDVYQSNIDDNDRLKLSQFIENGENFSHLKGGSFQSNEISNQKVVLAPSVSGSAVVATVEKISEISGQHRKIAALDMEIFGLYRAVEISGQKPHFFGSKVVVDLADEAKGDQYHPYGVTLSARFTVEAIAHLLS